MEEFKSHERSFLYSGGRYYPVMGIDLVLLLFLILIFIQSFLNPTKNSNNVGAFIFFCILFSNVFIDGVLIYHQLKKPDRISIHLCLLKGIFGFLGIFTAISGIYFLIITEKMWKATPPVKKYEPLFCPKCYNEIKNTKSFYCSKCGQKTEFALSLEDVKKAQYREKLKDFKKEYLKLANEGDSQYIENFQKLYPNYDINSTEFNKLKELLASKGHGYDNNQLVDLLAIAAIQIEYREIRGKMLHNNPKVSDDCIRNFLELFGNTYPAHIGTIETLLMNDFSYNGNLESDIARVIKKIELNKFESSLKSNDDSGNYYTIQDIDRISGYEFERILKQLFEKMGYTVTHTTLSNDQGADLLIERFGERTVVQSKNWQNNVGNTGVQEVVAAIKHYKSHKAMVISSSGFTNSAISLAKSNNVELWDRAKLSTKLKDYPISNESIIHI